MTEPTWGIVSTIKASSREILSFAAYHLDLGAHRLYIYLDEDAAPARHALTAHPKCRVILCDDSYWQRRFRQKGRPEKHQQRQSANATHCYRRRAEVAWLAHIDVDEFLWPARALSDQLAALPAGILSARIRPVEALAPDAADPPPPGVIYAKGLSRCRKERARQTQALFPTYGTHLNGGFLSHVEGKIFVRTGEENIRLRIHNAFRDGVMDDSPAALADVHLAHLHAPSWERFLAAFRFRHARGSYRSELKPAAKEGLTLHALFSLLEEDGGEAALRGFYEEVCVATPGLRARLDAEGLLQTLVLEREAKLTRHFPDFIDH